MTADKHIQKSCSRKSRWILAALGVAGIAAAGTAAHIGHFRNFEPLPGDLRIDNTLDRFDDNIEAVRARVDFKQPRSELEQFQTQQSKLAEQLAAEAVQAEHDALAQPEKNTIPEPKDFQPVKLKLTGIIRNNNARLALVNGQVLALGDAISGVKVTNITEGSVVFMDANGATKEVKIHESFQVTNEIQR